MMNTWNRLMNSFRKKEAPAKVVPEKPCCVLRCDVYGELDRCPRNLFDENFPSSSSLVTSVGYSLRGVRLGLDSKIKCKPDGSVSASALSHAAPVPCCQLTAKVKCSEDKRIGDLALQLGNFKSLPGFMGQASLTNDEKKLHVVTQYRHPRFSIVCDHVNNMENARLYGANVVYSSKKGAFAAGVSGKMTVRYSKDLEKKMRFMNPLQLCARITGNSWTVVADFKDAPMYIGATYSLSLVKKMLCPYFTNEMLLGVRLNGQTPTRKADDECPMPKSCLEKAIALKDATKAKMTVAMQTMLSDTSVAKIKIDTNGMFGASYSEKLSKYAHAVFAINVNAKNLMQAQPNMFTFTLTLAN